MYVYLFPAVSVGLFSYPYLSGYHHQNHHAQREHHAVENLPGQPNEAGLFDRVEGVGGAGADADGTTPPNAVKS